MEGKETAYDKQTFEVTAPIETKQSNASGWFGKGGTAPQNQITEIDTNGDAKKIKDLVGDGSLKHVDSANPITPGGN